MLFTGTVQTFTAPVDGIYQFELWGSPGGTAGLNSGYYMHEGGPGGYTKIYMRVDAGLLYVIVGGSGSPVTGSLSSGGYNGGGYTHTCPYGPHSASGGGMTHVSYTPNVAVAESSHNSYGSWNPAGTIAVAGGGGGGYISGRDVGNANNANGQWHGGAGGGQYAGNGVGYRGVALGATQTSGWGRGCGRSSNVGSSGGGGGWYGGQAIVGPVTGSCVCASPGGGGSGYICDAAKQTSYTPNNLCLVGTDPSIPRKPNAGTALGQHGYVRVLLIDRIN